MDKNVRIEIIKSLDAIDYERDEAYLNVSSSMLKLNRKYDDLLNSEVDITEEWFRQYSVFYNYDINILAMPEYQIREYEKLMKDFRELDLEIEKYSVEYCAPAKTTMLQKIWNTFKKFFKVMKTLITNLISTIRIIQKHKISKSVDQICLEIIGSYINILESADINSNTFEASEAHLAYKDLYIKIKNGKYEFHPLYAKSKGGNIDDVYNKNISMSAVLSFIIFNEDIYQLRTKLCDFVNSIQSHENLFELSEKSISLLDDILAIFELTEKKPIEINKYDVTIDSLLKTSECVNKIGIALSDIDGSLITYSNKHALNFNKLIKYFERLTYGCNMASVAINGMFSCDKRFENTISDIDQLSEFVKACITSGIPSKYIAYNTWLIMSDEFDNSYSWNKCGVKPKWGQTRVVFYPKNDDKVVLKIAMNSAGILGNKREMNVYNVYDKYKIADKYLAEPIKCSKNNCIVIMERCRTNSSINQADIDKFSRQLNEEYDKYNIPRIYDIHIGNFGRSMKDGSLKLIDYAGRTIYG